ncbi:DUF1190 domain-containing protein [Marinobacterium sp. D7]|uniref:DUF1190 domain-containing protein n=1 Tax=Marinobacterium ramblicola TaxID=2849041 RepID=UPI001C2DDB54|nr:DUF1190 domain-containing protein [Marinobacterium ramblicola]MBV1787410.1 DUF1190 domain-containing protein [Marinobacterium ramblicola]
MKRTKSIDLTRMRKQPRFRVTKLVAAVAGASLVTGCSSDSQDAMIYKTLQDCTKTNPGLEAECKAAYEDALEEAAKTAPKYRTQNDCEAEFGRCVVYRDSSTNLFMPLMAGYMMARAVDRREYDSTPVFSGYGHLYGGYYGADGTRYGGRSSAGSTRVSVPSDAFKPKPTVTRTISRGGFGSTAAAKSSWGSSSRSSWGG